MKQVYDARITNIVKRLRDRFQLRMPVIVDEMQLENRIVLISNADELLKDYIIVDKANFARTAVAGVGNMVIITVPQGERWHIKGVHILRASGDGTLGQLMVCALGNPAANYCGIFTQTAAGNLITQLLVQDAVLDGGDSLVVNVAAITGDTVWSLRMYYAKEDAF